MRSAPATADAFPRALRAVRSESELATIHKRLAPGDDAIGVRMRDLFDTAKAAMDMPLAEVDALFGSALYEARMGAACILDFRAKMPRTLDARPRVAGDEEEQDPGALGERGTWGGEIDHRLGPVHAYR